MVIESQSPNQFHVVYKSITIDEVGIIPKEFDWTFLSFVLDIILKLH